MSQFKYVNSHVGGLYWKCRGSCCEVALVKIVVDLSGGGGGVHQAYRRLSTTHGHITDCTFWIRWCIQVYDGVGVNLGLSCLGRTISARRFWGAKPMTQFRHR